MPRKRGLRKERKRKHHFFGFHKSPKTRKKNAKERCAQSAKERGAQPCIWHLSPYYARRIWVCRLIMFVAYDICRLIMLVAYDVCTMYSMEYTYTWCLGWRRCSRCPRQHCWQYRCRALSAPPPPPAPPGSGYPPTARQTGSSSRTCPAQYRI